MTEANERERHHERCPASKGHDLCICDANYAFARLNDSKPVDRTPPVPAGLPSEPEIHHAYLHGEHEHGERSVVTKEAYDTLRALCSARTRERDEIQAHCNRLTGMKFSERMHAALVSRATNAEATLAWKERELNGITRDLTEAGYAPKTLKHSAPDGTPQEDALTTAAIVMFALDDLKQQLTTARALGRQEGLEEAMKAARDRYELRLCEDSATSSMTDDYLLGYDEACVTIEDRIAALKDAGKGEK